jgi:hypothetical protein
MSIGTFLALLFFGRYLEGESRNRSTLYVSPEHSKREYRNRSSIYSTPKRSKKEYRDLIALTPYQKLVKEYGRKEADRIIKAQSNKD